MLRAERVLVVPPAASEFSSSVVRLGLALLGFPLLLGVIFSERAVRLDRARFGFRGGGERIGASAARGRSSCGCLKGGQRHQTGRGLVVVVVEAAASAAATEGSVTLRPP